MLELKETNHSYYCSETNYYVKQSKNYGRCDYDTWDEFKQVWLNEDSSIDCDYNLCFRYDIKQKRDIEISEVVESYELWLFFVLQRKGIYRPVVIRNITKDDMVQLETFLNLQWKYIKNQWQEINS